MSTETAQVTDQQIIKEYQKYKVACGLRDQQTKEYEAWFSSLDRMHPARASIWLFFGIGQPKALKDDTWTDRRLVEVLRKRPGTYPLTAIEASYCYIVSPFTCSFNFGVEGDMFEVSYAGRKVSVQLTRQPHPYIEVLEGQEYPALYLQRGFKIPITQRVVEGPYSRLVYGLWSPPLRNAPRVLTSDDLPPKVRWFDSPEEAIQAKVRTRAA